VRRCREGRKYSHADSGHVNLSRSFECRERQSASEERCRQPTTHWRSTTSFIRPATLSCGKPSTTDSLQQAIAKFSTVLKGLQSFSMKLKSSILAVASLVGSYNSNPTQPVMRSTCMSSHGQIMPVIVFKCSCQVVSCKQLTTLWPLGCNIRKFCLKFV